LILTKKNAFSLVEMLVAVILLTLLIGVAIFALKYQLISIHKTQKVGIKKLIIYNQIRASLQSIKYYIIDDYDMLGYPMKQLHPFFTANASELTYITTNPLFSKDVAVAQMRCQNDKLLYKEEKLYGNIDFLRPKLLQNSREKVFYNNLDGCSFSYIFKNQSYENLDNKIPSSIIINLSKQHIQNQIYVNIKSDYNISIGIIRDAIYPLK